MMIAVARELGIEIEPKHFRPLATAALVDMKYWRMMGGYKEDSIIDGINYAAFLAEDMSRLKPYQKEAVEKVLKDYESWFQTNSGLAFHHLNPKQEDIRIEDIAHALSMTCRFGGHVNSFYSVAQHSVMVSVIVPQEYALQALLHDAPEAYIGDMVNPLKCEMPEFRKLEKEIWQVIAKKFSLPVTLHESVKKADLVALATERRDLMGRSPLPWKIDEAQVEPNPGWIIHPQPPAVAKENFLLRYRELT